MLVQKRIISSLVAIAVVFQSLFISNGLLGICIMEAKALCTCNHSSKKEIHANSEDDRFSKQNIHFKKLTVQHSESDHNDLEPKILPNCHSAKSGEAHLCSCKKTEKSSQSLNPHLQSFFSYHSYSLSKPLIQKEVLQFLDSSTLLSGTLEDHFKPPKLS